MATRRSSPYSITSTTDGGVSSSNKYVAEFDNTGKLLAIYKKDSIGDFKILDPTAAEWSSVATAKGSGFTVPSSSGETLLQYNQNKHNTIGEWESSVPIAPEYLTYHNEIKNKEANVAAIPAGDTSEGAREIIATPPRVRTPQQFASPGSPRYTTGSLTALAYPYDIDITQDHLKITRHTYNRGGNVNLSAPDKGISLGTPLGTVILPMPKASEAGGAEWGESRVDVLGIGAANVFGGGVNTAEAVARGENPFKGKDGKGGTFGGIKELITGAKNVGDTVGGAAQIVGARYASQVVGALGITISPEDLITRATGNAVNPNAELLFRGPVLRDFGFRFTMIARSQPEASEIRKIVQFFKAGSAPKYQNAAFLGSPDIFQLEYKPQTVLNKFKPMSLNKITIDYAPDGYWAAYGDSHPVSIVMSLEFSEIVPVYDKDYATTDNTVGF